MAQEITTIVSHYSIISVNCYLVRNAAGYFLIDSGLSKTRADLLKGLESAGCRPGDLKLILLTHGDLDHTGNSTCLRQKFGAKIAMHRGDLENVESGDMFANKSTNPVDGVINHVSAQGEWFQAFLKNVAPYRDYFLTIEGNPDLSEVVRPRALPLLTKYQTVTGKRCVWTTFSADQVDLDYHNPDVLLEIFEILLMYAEHGAQFIRLDAIAYLWKEIGTTCIHLPQTHAVIQLLRAVLDEVAPHVLLITETNVPYKDNISYFGNGTNEAQLIYNFALPPLVLHTFRTGDASVLSEWAAGLELPSDQTTFFNFLASHDGIGLNPARGILSPAEIDGLVGQTLAHGGLISFKQNSDGTQSPYEMNINYFDALSDPAGGEPLELQVDRFRRHRRSCCLCLACLEFTSTACLVRAIGMKG
jgi:hypothetical protein